MATPAINDVEATTGMGELASDCELQVFDLEELSAQLAGSDGEVGAATAARFRSALEDQGFIYISNVGISDEEWTRFRDITHAYFHAPEEELQKGISKVPIRGLTRLEGDSTAKVVGTGEHTDLCMKYSMGISDNVFPSARFREVWEDIFPRLSDIGLRILNCVAGALELNPQSGWADAVRDAEPVLRHLYYPDVKAERCAGNASTIERMAAHVDLDLMTLLCQTPCPNDFVSLQAHINGQWVGVPARPGTLVVNFGAVLSAITGGRVRAAKHRVISPPRALQEGSSRACSALFLLPRNDLWLTPLLRGDIRGGDLEAEFGGELPPEGMSYKDFLGAALARFQGTHEAKAARETDGTCDRLASSL